jgi:hypothetical protein
MRAMATECAERNLRAVSFSPQRHATSAWTSAVALPLSDSRTKPLTSARTAPDGAGDSRLDVPNLQDSAKRRRGEHARQRQTVLHRGCAGYRQRHEHTNHRRFWGEGSGLTLEVTGAPRWRSRRRRHMPARPVDRKVRPLAQKVYFARKYS